MSRLFNIRRAALSFIAAAVFAIAGSNVAQAGDCYSHCPPKCVLVPYQVVVIRYDHCGRPYKTWETRYKKVCVYDSGYGY
jgi:hypothetical protein